MLNYQESGLSREVQAGQCRKDECDPITTKFGEVIHQARTGWQIHKNKRITDEEWALMPGLEQWNMDAAAWVATRIWVSMYWTCGGKLEGGIAAYAGNASTCQWEGAARRVRFYRMIRGQWNNAYRTALAQAEAEKPPEGEPPAMAEPALLSRVE
jgi:hypothetical protein